MGDRVFICYAREDAEFVLELAKNLKDKGVPVWLDQWDIPPAADWDKAIDDALYDCAHFLMVLSPSAVNSREVRGELRTALEEEKPIIPVLHKECRIPRQLRLSQHVNFTSCSPEDKSALEQVLRALGITAPVPTEAEEKEKVGEPPVEAAPQEHPPVESKPAESKPAEPKPIEPLPADLKPSKEEVLEDRKGKPSVLLWGITGTVVLLVVIGVVLYTQQPLKNEHTNTIGIKFVLIPAGTFMMGSPPEEPQRDSDERQHKVTITKPFYLQTTEVTQGQWKRVMGESPSDFKECGEDCPVECVSWNKVQEFIIQLNKIEDTEKYRLPTEAEWEYACRAGSTGAFCFGDSADQLKDYAWHKKNSQNKTHPVAQKKPNAWGLYDMHGNVREWCQDWYGDYPSGDVTDPKGPSSGDSRVLRGGAFRDLEDFVRCAVRSWFYPVDRSWSIGFRVVLSP